MKKLIVCVLNILVLLVFFTGCDPFAGATPDNYPNTRWVSENPDMYFEVGRDRTLFEQYSTADITYAQIIIDGEVIEMQVSFGPGGFIQVTDMSYDVQTGMRFDNNGFCEVLLFRGLCRFSPDSLTVYDIDKHRPGFLDGSIEEIVFIRVNIKQFRKGG